jgi:hypothetical protein
VKNAPADERVRIDTFNKRTRSFEMIARTLTVMAMAVVAAIGTATYGQSATSKPAMPSGYVNIGMGYAELYKKYDDKVQSILTDKQKADWQEQQKSWQTWRPVGGGQAPGGSGAPGQPMTPKK